MKGVDTIARVCREHFVRERSIKEICCELHVSGHTVWKILRSGERRSCLRAMFNLYRRLVPGRMIWTGFFRSMIGERGVLVDYFTI